MNLHFLGTSHGLATPHRFNSSTLLTSKTSSILIDCGEPASANLLRMGVTPEQPCAVILTHLHPDHTGSFTQLIQTLQLCHRSAPFTVYMPAEGIAVFKTLLRTVYMYDSIIPFRLTFKAMQPDRVYTEGPFELQFYPNEHLACFRSISKDEGYPAPCESFSVGIRADGQRVVFSGDIKNAGELAAPLRDGADLLVSELVHFSPDTFAALGNDLLPEKICFTHCSVTQEDVPLHKDNPVLASLKRNIVFVEDQQNITI